MKSPRKPLATRNTRNQGQPSTTSKPTASDKKNNTENYIKASTTKKTNPYSHTRAGDTPRGSLKDGSSRDQDPDDRFSLHLGDDYRVDRLTGEQDEEVRRQTGTANHQGGKADGTGGGKSSGSQGHGPQNWMQHARNTVRQQSKAASSKRSNRSKPL